MRHADAQSDKEKYPQAKVFVIGNIINKELLADNRTLTGILFTKTTLEIVKGYKKRKDRFCLRYESEFIWPGHSLSSRNPLIAVPIIENGFSPVETRLYKILRKLAVAVPHRMGNYAENICVFLSQ